MHENTCFIIILISAISEKNGAGHQSNHLDILLKKWLSSFTVKWELL